MIKPMNGPTLSIVFSYCVIFFAISFFLIPSHSLGDYSILKKHIISQNMSGVAKAPDWTTYRGEEGMLRIKPKVAQSLGMRVLIDQDYEESVQLFAQAEQAITAAKKALVSRDTTSSNEMYVQKIVKKVLEYQELTETAQRKMKAYHNHLNSKNDERLDTTVSARIMDQLLAESFAQTKNNLRDGLAHFYNLCDDSEQDTFPLTSNNVRFVNHVFLCFWNEASDTSKGLYHFDRDKDFGRTGTSLSWKNLAYAEIPQFKDFLATALEKIGTTIYHVDPVLFISLMRRESNFDPLAVSYVGAAGLTQVMPATGREMGMKHILFPHYFHDAVSMLKRERKSQSDAWATLNKITANNGVRYAKRARSLMQESLEFRHTRKELFTRYRRELLQKKTDDRLNPALAIEYGLRYFARMMRDQKGDISLALASYNAGPHRVTKYQGIPPFEETVMFRNHVLQFYRDYLQGVAQKQ